MTTATDETALLAAIRAQPDEDTPRLAYADWLDENPDVKCPRCGGFGSFGARLNSITPEKQHDTEPPCYHCNGAQTVRDDGRTQRAEFIRVQVALARTPAMLPPGQLVYSPGGVIIAITMHETANSKHAELKQRQRELLDTRHPVQDHSFLADHWFGGVGAVVTHGAAGPCWWYPPAPDGATGYPFAIERGFVSWFELPADVWLRHGDAVRASHPVALVQLTSLPDVVAHPSGMWFADDPKAELFTWPQVTPEELKSLSPPELALQRIRIALGLRFADVKFDLPRLISDNWGHSSANILDDLAAMRERMLRETGRRFAIPPHLTGSA